MSHVKIKNPDGETVKMCDSVEEAEEKMEDMDGDLHIADFT